jgi:hypothetical protein
MMLAQQPFRIVESTVRRAIGAFRFVDAITNLPVVDGGTIAVRSASVGQPPVSVAVDETNVQIRRNRSGAYVLFRAPFFDKYTTTFEQPAAPPETATGPLRLRLGATDPGPQYLPIEFDVALPRPLDPNAADNVFTPQPVIVYRSPSAPVQYGWSVLRVLVTQKDAASLTRLPGVLIRVFKAPRGAEDKPIGVGLTEWRGDTRGEALVPVAGLLRFPHGEADAVVEQDHEIVFEVARDTAFTGAPDQLPNVARIAAAAPAQLSVISPSAPVKVRAGKEHTIHLVTP